MQGSRGGPWSAESHGVLYPGNLNRGLFKFMVEYLRPNNFLEFGSGMGLLAKELASALPIGDSYGIEPDIEISSVECSPLTFLNFDVFHDIAPAVLDQKFDLVLSIEVAEHIPREQHEALFDFLASRAGRWVVFSGARIGQGGHGHIAERTEDEWRSEWTSRGFHFDARLTSLVRCMSDSKNINHRKNLQVFQAPTGFEALDEIERRARPYLRDILGIVERKSDFLDGNLFFVNLNTAASGMPEDSLRLKRRNLLGLAKSTRSALEVGFNAGHSALLLLLANPGLNLTVVDLLATSYAQACFDYLNSVFPGRMRLIGGDSRGVLPLLSGQRFDLVHIDGGKDATLESDLAMICNLVDDDHVLVIDDTQNSILNEILCLQEQAGVVECAAFSGTNSLAASRRWKHRLGRFSQREDRCCRILDRVAELCSYEEFPSIYTRKDDSGRVLGYSRAKALIDSVRAIEDEGVHGAVVEVGVAAGHSSLIAALSASRFIAREFWLFDTYAGFQNDLPDELDHSGNSIRTYDLSRYSNSICGVDAVRDRMLRAGVAADRLFLVEGPIEQTALRFDPGSIAILRLDVDLFGPTLAALEAFYDRIAPGGWLIVDDYGHWRGCRQAVDAYFSGRGEAFSGIPLDYTCHIFRKPFRQPGCGASRVPNSESEGRHGT